MKSTKSLIRPIERKSTDKSEFNPLSVYESTYSPLKRTDFDMKIIDQWCEIRAKNAPKRRSFHTSFQYKNYLYIFGGLDILEGKLNDFHRINLLDETPKWEEVFPGGAQIDELAYHAAAEISGVYYIIGGQNSAMLGTNSVYAFDVDKNLIEKTTFKVK